MDVDMPGLTPTEAAGILKAAYPEMNIVLYTVHGKDFLSPMFIRVRHL